MYFVPSHTTRASSSEVSAECRELIDRHVGRQLDNHSRSTYQPTYRSSVGRHIDRCSTDMSIYMSTNTSRSTYRATLDRYVGRHIDRYSTDMSTDTLVESRSICRPIYRSRGAQNTHDPMCIDVFLYKKLCNITPPYAGRRESRFA